MAQDDRGNLGHGLAQGLEVAVGVTLGYFAGNWFDHRYGSKPWGLLVGVLVGCAAGMYLLIKEAVGSDKK